MYNDKELRDDRGRWVSEFDSKNFKDEYGPKRTKAGVTDSALGHFTNGGLGMHGLEKGVMDFHAPTLFTLTPKKLTNEQKQAAARYATDAGYKVVNEKLRFGTVVSKSSAVGGSIGDHKNNFKSTLKGLDEITHGSAAKEDVAVYRNVGPNFKLKVGTTFTDKGFVSTSLSKNIVSDASNWKEDLAKGQIARIVIAKGTPAAYIGNNNAEVLLPRGSSFKVEGLKKGVYQLSYTPPSK